MDTLKDLSLAEIMGTHLNEEAVALVEEESEDFEDFEDFDYFDEVGYNPYIGGYDFDC
jgi:hypothetical protein